MLAVSFLGLVKFIYSEKATKCFEIFTLLLFYVVPFKSKVKISQNFVAFSEYMNFTFWCEENSYGLCFETIATQKVHFFLLFRPFGAIMMPIPVITIILMLAIKIRSYRYNVVVHPNLPIVQPPKNLESVWLNMILLILIFANMAGYFYYYTK